MATTIQPSTSIGDGYMLSAFVSREFGFGWLLTGDKLARINSQRRTNGATYTDTHAAMEVLGSINKLPFTELPFVKYLFIGARLLEFVLYESTIGRDC